MVRISQSNAFLPRREAMAIGKKRPSRCLAVCRRDSLQQASSGDDGSELAPAATSIRISLGKKARRSTVWTTSTPCTTPDSISGTSMSRFTLNWKTREIE